MAEGTQPADQHDVSADVVAAFLDQARALAEWEWRRADGFQSKAGLLLGASGVVLSILVGSLTDLPDDPIAFWMAAAALSLVLAAAACAVIALWPRKFTHAAHDDLEHKWRGYQHGNGEVTGAWQVTALSTTNLLMAEPGLKSTLESLSAEARSRGRHFKAACSFFLAALMALTMLTLVA